MPLSSGSTAAATATTTTKRSTVTAKKEDNSAAVKLARQSVKKTEQKHSSAAANNDTVQQSNNKRSTVTPTTLTAPPQPTTRTAVLNSKRALASPPATARTVTTNAARKSLKAADSKRSTAASPAAGAKKPQASPKLTANDSNSVESTINPQKATSNRPSPVVDRTTKPSAYKPALTLPPAAVKHTTAVPPPVAAKPTLHSSFIATHPDSLSRPHTVTGTENVPKSSAPYIPTYRDPAAQSLSMPLDAAYNPYRSFNTPAAPSSSWPQFTPVQRPSSAASTRSAFSAGPVTPRAQHNPAYIPQWPNTQQPLAQYPTHTPQPTHSRKPFTATRLPYDSSLSYVPDPILTFTDPSFRSSTTYRPFTPLSPYSRGHGSYSATPSAQPSPVHHKSFASGMSIHAEGGHDSLYDAWDKEQDQVDVDQLWHESNPTEHDTDMLTPQDSTQTLERQEYQQSRPASAASHRSAPAAMERPTSPSFNVPSHEYASRHLPTFLPIRTSDTQLLQRNPSFVASSFFKQKLQYQHKTQRTQPAWQSTSYNAEPTYSHTSAAAARPASAGWVRSARGGSSHFDALF